MVESTVESSTETVLNVAKAEAIRVLHVDDDQAFLKVAKQCLDTQGEFEVDTASSVKEALEKLEKTDYDAVVSDYQMPGKDGLEFLKELREKGNTVPFIVFTGKGREEIAIKALNLGADGYFNKSGHPETVYGELAHGTRQVVGKRRAEQSFLKSEDKYRRLVETLHEGIWAIDKDSRTTFVNPRMAEILGYDTEEMKGRHLFSFMDERGVEIAERLLERRRQGIKEQYDFEFLRKDGTRVYTTLETSPITDDNGNYVGALASVMDITERKQWEETLRDAKEKWASLTENTDDIVMITDNKSVIQFINRTIPPYTPEETVGKTVYDYVPREQHDVFEKSLREVFKTGKPDRYEVSSSIPKIGTIWFSTKIVPIKHDRKVVAAILISADITDRKKAEGALLKSEEKYRLFVQGLQGIAYQGDTGFNADFLNGPIKEITGYSEEELLKGKIRWDKLIHEEDSARILNCVKESISNKQKSGRLEYRIVRKDGTVKWIRQMFNHLFDDSGEVTGSQGILYDTTEEKKTEEALRQSEEGYRELAESIDDVFFAMDKNFRYTYWNKASEKLTGVSAKDAIGKSLTEVFPEVKGTKMEQVYLKTLRTQQPQSCLNKYQLRGKDYVFEINAYPTQAGLSVLVKDITEREKTEEMLRESEEKLRNVFAASPDAITVSDLNGNIVECNQATVALHGCASKEELIGKNSLELIAKKDHKRAIEIMKKTLEHGSTKNVEYTFVAKDGREFPAELSASVVTDASGKPEYYMAVTKDITERKKAGEELFDELSLMQLLLGNHPDFIYFKDSEARFQRVSKRFCDFFELDKEDIIGKTDLELFPEEVAKQTYSEDLQIIKTGKPIINKEENAKGTWVLTTKMPRFDKNGKIVGLFGISRDITDRKKAEEELKSSEQKFRGLVEDSAAAIATIDLKGRLTYVNKALADSLGYSVQELSGRAFKDFLHPDDRGNLVRLFLKIIVLRRKPRKFEFRALRKDGTILHLNCRPTRLETAGKTSGFQAILTDNTEEKHMLEKVEKINEKLSVVGGLTRHDVNNKLSTILNVSYLLKQKLRDNQSLELVKATESAVHQVEGLFEFARTYEKLGTEELAYVDAEKVFNEAARLFPSLQNIKTVNDCHGLTVFADSLLRQLFYNLVDNSLKHGEKVGQVRVHYQTDGDRVKLIYEDDGIGVPKAEKDKIFKEGYGKNSGHGLYMIKRMCEVYGWTIQETGKQGKGAQFTINMPRLSQTEDQTASLVEIRLRRNIDRNRNSGRKA